MQILRSFICIQSISVVSCLLFVFPVRAQNGSTFRAQSPWGVGAAVIVATSPYRGSDVKVLPIPMVTYNGPRFTWMGPRASYRLTNPGLITLGAVAEYQFYGALDTDNEFMRGMHDRKGTLEGGLELKGKLSRRFPGSFSWELKGTTDLLGVHDGQEVQLSAGPSFRRSGWMLKPSVAVKWLSPDFTGYYFGVRDDETAPGRPAYTPGSAINWSPRLTVIKSWCTVWSATGSAGIEFLDQVLADSPIVDDDRSYNLIVGISRSF